MYLKKVSGPRTVTLPDGTHMSRADLPSPSTTHWVASRKIAIVKAVAVGLITREEACEEYALSSEEFEHWCQSVKDHGEKSLRTTALQKYRQL